MKKLERDVTLNKKKKKKKKLTLLVCNEALLSSLLMSGDCGDVLGVGHGALILPGDPGLPGLLGRSGELTGLVSRGLDRNVMFIGVPNVFLPWNLTGESFMSTCSLLAVNKSTSYLTEILTTLLEGKRSMTKLK